MQIAFVAMEISLVFLNPNLAYNFMFENIVILKGQLKAHAKETSIRKGV